VQVALQIAQSVPARVFLLWLASTASLIEVLAAPWAQTLTVDPANRLDGYSQQNLFAKNIFQLQPFAFIVADFGLGLADGDFFLTPVDAQWTVQQIKRTAYLL
jgi:hypothetical protein